MPTSPSSPNCLRAGAKPQAMLILGRGLLVKPHRLNFICLTFTEPTVPPSCRPMEKQRGWGEIHTENCIKLLTNLILYTHSFFPISGPPVFVKNTVVLSNCLIIFLS